MTPIEIDEYLKHLRSIVDFQTSNGLLTEQEAKALLRKITRSARILSKEKLSKNDLVSADTTAREAYASMVATLNGKPLRRRLTNLWGLPLWVFLLGLTGFLLVLAVMGWINRPIFLGISGDTIVWGGLGGCAYSIFYLRSSIYKLQFSKYYSIYWLAYPFAAMIFGLGVAVLFATGFLAIDAKPTPEVYAGIAFVSGMFQEWALGTFRDIAYAIHPPGK